MKGREQVSDSGFAAASSLSRIFLESFTALQRRASSPGSWWAESGLCGGALHRQLLPFREKCAVSLPLKRPALPTSFCSISSLPFAQTSPRELSLSTGTDPPPVPGSWPHWPAPLPATRLPRRGHQGPPGLRTHLRLRNMGASIRSPNAALPRPPEHSGLAATSLTKPLPTHPRLLLFVLPLDAAAPQGPSSG